MSASSFNRLTVPDLPNDGGEVIGRVRPLPQALQLPATNQLHHGVLALMIGAFAWMFLVFCVVFRADKEALFAVAISIVYTIMYFAVPLACYRIAKTHGLITEEKQSFGAFLHRRMNTATGPILGWEAAVQVCGIPVALAIAATGIGIALRLV